MEPATVIKLALSSISSVLSSTIAYSIVKRRKTIVPIALRSFVDNMAGAVVIVDSNNRVIDCNKAFTCGIPGADRIKDNSDLSCFIDSIETSINGFNGELTFRVPETRHFRVNMLPILKRSNNSYGRIISFEEITAYRNLLTELNDKNTELMGVNDELDMANKELEAANIRLNEYAAAMEELSVTRVRNRIARDVNNNLAHTFNHLTALIEKSCSTYRSDPEKTENSISTAISAASIGLKELKRYISGLTYDSIEQNSIINALENLTMDYRSLGVNIDFTIENSSFMSEFICQDTVYWICKEALTNSLLHGKAKNVTIFIRCAENMLKLHIIDDGYGCKNFKKGIGLLGLEERVKRLNGETTYGSGEEGGFNIYVELSLK